MMLVDLHAHTSGMSPCCEAPAEVIIEEAKRADVEALLLTNHYCKNYVTTTPEDYAKRYVEEYEYTKSLGDKAFIPVFFGIEVTMEKEEHAHFVAIGVDEDFALMHPEMYDYTSAELLGAVHEVGGILIQAHPYRRGNRPMFDSLDGAEASCHPLYCGTHIDELTPALSASGKILTVGGDYHHDTRRTSCGVYLPRDIGSSLDIANYLKSAKAIKYRIEEPWSTERIELEYSR